MRWFAPAMAAGIVGVAASAMAAASDPLTVVQTFIAATSNDRTSAQLMLTKDAGFGAGDVGGPFLFEVYDGISKDCRFDTSAAKIKPLGMPDRNIVTVEVDLVCQREGDQTSTIPAAFMVEGDRIAGLYLKVKSGLGAAQADESK